MRCFIMILFMAGLQAAVTGEWTGSGIVLLLEADEGDAVEGEMTVSGQTFAVTGTAQGDRFSGTFGNDAASFPLTLSVSGDRGLLESQGNRYQLTRKPSAVNPLAQAPAAPNPLAAGPTPSDQAAVVPASGGLCTQTYTHPLGISFRHPPTWQVQDAGEAVLLLPPDMAQRGGMQAEMTLLFGDAQESVGTMGGPQMQQVCSMVVAQMLPGLQPQGQGQQVADGMRYDYAGQHQQLQCQVKASLWVRFTGPYVVGVLAAAEPAVYQRRAGVWQELFMSFGYEQPPVDQRLVGSWMYENVYASGDFSMVTVQYLKLTADGRCALGSDAAASSDAGSVISDGQGWDKTGTWQAADKRITLTWSDGSSETWDLIADGGSMLWKSDGNKKLWQRR